MLVSIIINGHTMDRRHDMLEAITDLRENQTHNKIEIIPVIDNNLSLKNWLDERIEEEIYLTETQSGCPGTRNLGASHASGDLLVFMDDDAIADPMWIENLVTGMEKRDHMVGGPIDPMWMNERPIWFPNEFFWLIGCTPDGFAEDKELIRNTFGSNLGIRRETFEEVGGFGGMMGRVGDEQGQGGETELCRRIREKTGRGVRYIEDAQVYHRIYEYRTDPQWLLGRCFGQGKSKAKMGADSEESDFLQELLTVSVPSRVLQILFLVLFTGATGLGWLSEKL